MSPSRSDLRQSVWLLFIPILWWGSSAASGWLNPSFQSPNFEFLEFAVHPARTADYGIDLFTSAMAPIDLSIIDEALTDQGNSAPLIPLSIEPDPEEAPQRDEDDSDSGQGAPNPAPQPTTDPGNNGNGNGGNGNSGGNGNGNDGENGNGGGGGNGSGNGGGNDKDKGNGKNETGLVPSLTKLLASL